MFVVADVWEDNWGWGEEENCGDTEEQNEAAEVVDDWLSECEISASPLVDLLVIAKSERICILQGKMSARNILSLP